MKNGKELEEVWRESVEDCVAKSIVSSATGDRTEYLHACTTAELQGSTAMLMYKMEALEDKLDRILDAQSDGGT